MAERTQTDRAMEDAMLAFAGDHERVRAIATARAFKRSWIELAEVLIAVRDRDSWSRWGYDTFEIYCRKELHLKTSTVHKLVGSYSFLKTSAPKVLERSAAGAPPGRPVPSMQAVDFVARATERGAADEATLGEIRRAAFDEGTDAPVLARRYKTVAFPVDAGEQRERLLSQLISTARRMANLIADPDCPLAAPIAIQVEEALGALLEALEG
jgi:hypothetical protein